MEKFDFIPDNKVRVDENNVELICRTIMDDMGSSIYDGRNHYAPKVGVCIGKGGKYKWGCDGDYGVEKFLFYPTVEEIKKARQVFTSKGYFPYYDNDVCYYKVAKAREDVNGKYAIMHTVWL